MVVKDLSIGVEKLGFEVIGAERRFCLFGLLTLYALPFDIMGSRNGVADVFNGFEVIGEDPALDVGLELPRLGFDLAVNVAIAFGFLLWVILFDVRVGS